MKLFFPYLFLLAAITGTAQQVQWEKRYDCIGSVEGGLSIIDHDSGYYVIDQIKDVNNINWYLTSISFDTLGNEQWKKIYGQSNYNYFGGNGGSLKKIKSGGYVLGGGVQLPDNNDQALLVRYAANMDTVWTKQFGDTAFNAGRQVVQTPDSGFALLCETDKFGSTDIQLIKTDKDGNFLWEKFYGDNGLDFPSSMDATADSGFIIGSIKTNTSWDSHVTKTDSLGNVEWTKTFGHPAFDEGAPNVIQVSDGGYLVSNHYSIAEISQSTTERRLNLIRLDENGDVLWDRMYGPKYHTASPDMVKELPDGSFVMANVTDGPNNEFAEGLLWKVNANGDSLWSRRFELLTGTWSRNYFRDFTLTKDGGFAICGFVQPVAPDGGNQDMWLLKLDSMGCLVSGCDTVTGVKTLKQVQGDNIEVNVYPNPANSSITIKYNGDTDKNMQLFYIAGRQNAEWQLENGETTKDISHLPAGVYFYKAGTVTGKLVIQR